MIDEKTRQAVVESFKLVVPIAETAADLFYKRLFELRPEYRSLFPEDLEKQKRKLVTMLAFIVKAIDFRDAQWKEKVEVDTDLFFVTLALGRRHSELYRIPEDSYGPVGEALLWTLDYGLGEKFTPQVKAAWTSLYTSLSITMQLGSRAKVDINTGLVA